MTVTANPGIWRDERHRYYVDGTGPLPGVTSIIGVLAKPALVGWAKRETAACAVRNVAQVYAMVQRGDSDGARQWLARLPDYQRDQSADLGHSVHALADRLVRGEEIEVQPEVVMPYLDAYRRFLDDRGPEVLVSELMIANLALGYGGTLDWGGRLDGANTMLDIKTGKGVYPETALQLAGYDGGEFAGWPGDPKRYRLPTWDAHAVLHLTPGQPVPYRLVYYDVTDRTREAFRAALTLYRWQQQKETP